MKSRIEKPDEMRMKEKDFDEIMRKALGAPASPKKSRNPRRKKPKGKS